MRGDLAVLVASSTVFVLAVALAVTRPAVPRRSIRPNRPAAFPIVVATAAAVGVLALSGWVAPSLVVGAVAFRVAARRGGPAPSDGVATTEGLASWIENLRDVLLAGDQPVGAIRATVATCPPAIRPAVRRLAASLGHLPAEVAFRRFADEVDDPLGDLVAAGLLVAVQRGARTVGVLTSLAAQARTQADRRRIVEAERAPLRREVRLLTAVMAALVVGLFVFGRADYLQPYDTARGQMVLAVVLAAYAALLLRVRHLARFPRPRRFLHSMAEAAR